MVVAATPDSPSVTSAFQGWLPLESSLFRLITVPSIVGVLKVIESPLVARFVAGIPNFTRYNQKYLYFPFERFARNPIATGKGVSSLVEMMTLFRSIVIPVRAAATDAPISSTLSDSVPDLNSFTTSEAPSSAYRVASASSTERSAEIALASCTGVP